MEQVALHVSALLTRLAAWAPERRDLLAVAVLGSYARNMGRPDSDLDLILLTTHPQRYLRQRSWLSTFGECLSTQEEDWGEITSLRVHYRAGLEVEFGVGRPAWAGLPPDEGTRRVVQDGLRPLYDPAGLLQRLQSHCSRFP
jgi:predicted nucleotidyltransferase